MSKPGQKGVITVLVVYGTCSRIRNMSLCNDAHCRLEMVNGPDRAHFREKTNRFCAVKVFELEICGWGSRIAVLFTKLFN